MLSLDHQKHLAYARQSRSDYAVYLELCALTHLPSCHRLHYLQMALEKLAKAYYWHEELRARRSGRIEESHSFIVKGLPAIYENYYRRRHRQAPPRAWVAGIRKLCRELDRLAPSVDPIPARTMRNTHGNLPPMQGDLIE